MPVTTKSAKKAITRARLYIPFWHWIWKAKKKYWTCICRKVKALTSGYPYWVACKTVALKLSWSIAWTDWPASLRRLTAFIHRLKCNCALFIRYATRSKTWHRSITKRLWPIWSQCTGLCQRGRRDGTGSTGVSSIRWCSCRGVVNGKNCQRTCLTQASYPSEIVHRGKSGSPSVLFFIHIASGVFSFKLLFSFKADCWFKTSWYTFWVIMRSICDAYWYGSSGIIKMEYILNSHMSLSANNSTKVRRYLPADWNYFRWKS